MGPFFLLKILFFSGALGLGLTCLGLEPALCENRTIKCEDLATWYNSLLTF